MKIGILWDLDGTLLDTLDDLADSVNYALSQGGFPLRTREEVRKFVGNGARRLIHLALPEDKKDAEDEILSVFQAYYKENAEHKTCPYAGVLDALSALKEKYPMAIVSNKPDGAVKVLCSRYFPGIYARGERADCPRKPAPDMVRRTMEDLGLDGCIYVGDSEVDVLTAENAQVPCLSVLWGFRDEEVLREAGAKAMCREPAQLIECIEKLIKEQF